MNSSNTTHITRPLYVILKLKRDYKHENKPAVE